MQPLTSFEVRTDARRRFESELFVPFGLMCSLAILLGYAWTFLIPRSSMSSAFAAHAPNIWLALCALAVFAATLGLFLSTPRKYQISANGFEIVFPLYVACVPGEEISEIVLVGGTRDIPLQLELASLLPRIVDGLSSLRYVFCRSADCRSGNYAYGRTGSGGAKVLTRQGATIWITPVDISQFAKDVEWILNYERKLNVPIVNETLVQLK